MNYRFTTADDILNSIKKDEELNEEYIKRALITLDGGGLLSASAKRNVIVHWRMLDNFVVKSNSVSRAKLLQILREEGGYKIEEFDNSSPTFLFERLFNLIDHPQPTSDGFVILQVSPSP